MSFKRLSLSPVVYFNIIVFFFVFFSYLINRSHLKDKLYYTLVKSKEAVWIVGHEKDELIVNSKL